MTSTMARSDVVASGGELLRWLEVLSRLADEVNSVQDIGPFLDQVATMCAELSRCDFSMLRLEQAPHLSGTSGLPSAYYERLVADPDWTAYDGEVVWSAIAEAIATGSPVAVPDFHAEPRLAYWTPTADAAGIRSYASFPLMAASGCLGVLNVYYRNPHDYSAIEMSVVRALAGYAAIAIETATLRKERETQLAALKAMLDRQRRIEELHQAITLVALTRKGAIGTLHALRDVLGATAVFQDAVGHVVAECSAAVTARDELRWITRLAPPEGADRRSSAAALLSRGPSRDRVVYRAPVIVDRATGGTISMVVDTALDPDVARQGLEYAALALALEQTGRAIEDQDRERVFEDLLAEMLSATDTEHADLVLEKALRSGHPLVPPLGLAVTGVPGPRGDKGAARRLISRFRRRIADTEAVPFVSRRGSMVALIWSEAAETGDWDSNGSQSTVARAVAVLAELSGGPTVVCPPTTEVVHLDATWRIGARVLGLANLAGDDHRVIDARRMRLLALLAESSDPKRLLEFCDRTLGALIEYDRVHHASLLETLEVSVDHDFRNREVAQALIIHPNTLTYRLGRIGEILGIDLRSQRDLLDVQLALTVRRALAGG